jgi:hypothetical protein
LIRSTPTNSLNFNRTNLPTLETQRRVERLVPPMGFWNTYGISKRCSTFNQTQFLGLLLFSFIVQDTERWKQELATLATASGLGVEKDDQRNSHKAPQTTATPIDQQNASRSGAHYSTRTGRFNEGTGKSRGRTSTKHSTGHPDILFNVPENEREMWVRKTTFICFLLGISMSKESKYRDKKSPEENFSNLNEKKIAF